MTLFLGSLVTATGGQIYYYPNFTREIHQEQIYRELYRNLTRPHGSDTILRLRTSQGISVKTQYGHVSPMTETDLMVPYISADSTIAFELDFDDTVTEDSTYSDPKFSLIFSRRRRLFPTCHLVHIAPWSTPHSRSHITNSSHFPNHKTF